MSEVVEIPGTADVLVMTDYLNERGIHANLYRSRRHDDSWRDVWRAVPQGGDPDAWTEFTLDGSVVKARSWSDFMVSFDLDTGEELSREFVGRP